MLLKVFFIISLTIVCCNSVSSFKKCGEIVCDLDEYCSPIHDQCEKCSKICNDISKIQLCLKECQEYFHEEHHNQAKGSLDEIKQKLNEQNALIIVILVLLVLIIVFHLFKFIKWGLENDFHPKNCISKNNFRKKQKITSNQMQENPTVITQRQNSGASTIFTIPENGNNSVHTVTTTLNSRHPEEDSTLDYSYDNGGLVVSK